MSELLRRVWVAVRPITAQQRFLWWCGTLMLACGAVHAVVDGAPWWGAVSWRKPVVFGMSLGLLACSAVWVLRQLPVRRWFVDGALRTLKGDADGSDHRHRARLPWSPRTTEVVAYRPLVENGAARKRWRE